MESSDDLFLNILNVKTEHRDNPSIIFTTFENNSIPYIRINKKDKTVHQVDRFYLDIFDTYTRFPNENYTSNDKIFYKINALRIINMAEKKKEVGEELTPRLKELSEQLTEDNNPVIIVGELK